jgi:hypothetical protein
MLRPFLLPLLALCCSGLDAGTATASGEPPAAGSVETLSSMFPPPPSCERVEAVDGSYAAYLRNLPLEPRGSVVHDFEGNVVDWGHALGAVLDIDLIKTNRHADLQQCADLAVRLWGEHSWQVGAADRLAFSLQNGQSLSWIDWRRGTRGIVTGNRHVFARTAKPDATHANFRAYLGYVMAWLGSAGIKAHAATVSEDGLRPGDLFVQNSTGAIGHVTILADICERAGERRYLVVQSYMPAQDGHVVLPAAGEGEGAWFTLDGLRAHQARFGPGVFRRFDCPQ